jgi:hypothetical protein
VACGRLPGHPNSVVFVAYKSPTPLPDQLNLEPSDQLASLLELAGRGPGPLEAAQLRDVGAKVRRDPLEQSVELRGRGRHAASS